MTTGIANFSRKNVDTDKEEFVMTYTVKSCESMEELETLKKGFDKVVIKAGGQTTLDDTSSTE